MSNIKTGLSLKEIEEKEIWDEIYYNVFKNGWYRYAKNGKWILCKSNGEIVVENVDDCWVYDKNYEDNHYEYEIDNKKYYKNFDGSDYEE